MRLRVNDISDGAAEGEGGGGNDDGFLLVATDFGFYRSIFSRFLA